jgi:hypothetical protein
LGSLKRAAISKRAPAVGKEEAINQSLVKLIGTIAAVNRIDSLPNGIIRNRRHLIDGFFDLDTGHAAEQIRSIRFVAAENFKAAERRKADIEFAKGIASPEEEAPDLDAVKLGKMHMSDAAMPRWARRVADKLVIDARQADTRGARRVSESRDREMVADHQGRRDQG